MTAPITVPTRTIPDGSTILLSLLADGLNNREIGKRLRLSPHAVDRHISYLLSANGLRSRSALVAWAYRTRILERVPSPSRGPHQTERRIEVLQHVLAGETDDEMAQALGIGPNGVRKHLRTLYFQLKARNRSQLTKIAVDTSLVDLDAPDTKEGASCSGR